ncbi:MAG TPA: 30S ribosomal protein S6e [Candidatus Thermoplasmatota archaeon]|nr:30S ribosomal protein S6e [Candidatus Thermoplasmatota archaeon]
MASFKLVINDPATGKSYKFEVSGHHAQTFVNKKIGDQVDGINANLPGYKLQIMGGSDKSGFPMRGDVEGTQRRRLLLTEGIGFHPTDYPGKRKRVSVRGNRISNDIIQVNLKVVKAGSKPVADHFAALEPKKA